MHKKQWWFGCLLFPLLASAQPESFRETAQHTLLTNPEVQTRYHTWQAARDERAAAAGGYYPRVDLTAGGLREERRRTGLHDHYNTTQATLTLTQMLFDGFATRNEVARLDHGALVRFFELHETSELVTLELIRAYEDVARYRTLVALAEENFARHRALFDLVQEKVQAGVGRRVDLETASGRLALAETNLLTELSNLHDVTARFIRLTGKAPSPALGDLPNLANNMPPDAKTALHNAIERSPGLWAAVQNVRAARHAAEARHAGFVPRFDFQARSNSGHNVSGIPGRDTVNSAGVVMNWNLLSGGSDMARVRQFAQQLNAAQDQLDQGCRNLRQTLLIAYNDTQKLAAQILYLDQHQLSTEKARDAYRKQFDIGQRSLLDLLDTENELFQARRSYTNAVRDLEIAYARVSASQGRLVNALGLTAPGSDKLPELLSDMEAQEILSQCQVTAPLSYAVDKEAIEKRVTELKKESAVSTPSDFPPTLVIPQRSSPVTPAATSERK